MRCSFRRSALLSGCALAALSVLAHPGTLQSQSLLSAVDVGSSALASANGRTSILLVRPAVRWERARASVDAQGTWRAAPDGAWAADGLLHAAVYSAVRAGMRAELSSTAEHGSARETLVPANFVGGTARLSFARGDQGGWVGATRTLSAGVTLPPVADRVDAGVWRSVGGAVFSASFTTTSFASTNAGARPDSIARFDTLAPRASALSVPQTYGDLESRVHWSRGALALDGAVGARVTATDHQGASWGRGEAMWLVSQRVAMIAAAGTRPPDPSRGTSGGRFASIAMRLTSVPGLSPALPGGVRARASAFTVVADGAMRIIRLRAPAARVVELMADFTDWQATAMRRAGVDEWELAMRITPGAHRLNIRIDGAEWRAPPGTATVDDEFNGVVGIVVVP